MAAIIIDPVVSVAFDELKGSPTEGQSQGEFTANRELRCQWSDRLALMTQLLGGVVTSGPDDTDQTITRADSYPHYARARARSVSIKPWFPEEVIADAAEGNKVASYTHAQLSVGYDTKIDEDDQAGANDEVTAFATETIEVAAEFLTMPHQRLHWANTNGPPLKDIEAPAKLIPTLVWAVTLHRRAKISSAMISGAGKTNSAAVTSSTLGYTFPAETLLYEPAGFERELTPVGVTAWKVGMRFTYRENGWNKFWRRDTNSYDVIFDADASATLSPYGSFAFSNLGV